MEKQKSAWRQKLLLVLTSSIFVLVVIGAGEIYCRGFTRINFLDNSRGLFTYGRFGNSYGNTPNFEGVSFGQKFKTDAEGFRVDPEVRDHPPNGAPAILIMGDSVAFGPAVPAGENAAGLLQTWTPGKRIINGAVIGYDTFDYKNAIDAITATHPEIREVVVVFCLNDVSDASAQAIRNSKPEKPQEETNSWSPVRIANDYLRSRSKLYLWLKNALVDTQLTYFKFDLASYQLGEENVAAALRPLIEVGRTLAEKGIKLRVFVSPYEAQLRQSAPEDAMLPQREILEILKRNDVETVDVAPAFAASGPDTNALFLYGDPMHLSPSGSRILALDICRSIEGCNAER